MCGFWICLPHPAAYAERMRLLKRRLYCLLGVIINADDLSVRLLDLSAAPGGLRREDAFIETPLALSFGRYNKRR